MRELLVVLILVFGSIVVSAQQDTSKVGSDTMTYRITKQNGYEFIGRIKSRDAYGILLISEKIGEVHIPLHEVAEINLVNPTEYDSQGRYLGEDLFATRYFITTNGFPVRKGDHYVQWNLFGPDFQFGVGDNVGVGVMTSWVGIPIIGTFKYSIPLSEKWHMAIGALAGTGSWAAFDIGGGLPYVSVTYGSRTSNITFSGGYGFGYDGFETLARPVAAVSGMTKVGEKLSLVFDSFIVLPGGYRTTTQYVYDPSLGYSVPTQAREYRTGGALLIPGLRWHNNPRNAFQFGFGGLVMEEEFVPVPIPMVQWFRKL